MSDALERIWAWNPDNYTKTVGFETQSGNKETTEYIRADIHEAKVKELEKALTKIANQHTVYELIKKGVENGEYDDKLDALNKIHEQDFECAYGKMILVARDALKEQPDE